MDERRKFERVRLPESAALYVLDENGQRAGRVLKLGTGGLLLETTAKFAEGSPQHFMLVEESESIRRALVGVVRYGSPGVVGLEFRALDIESAIDIGILIGKYSVSAVQTACA
jgi:hypothetical protein